VLPGLIRSGRDEVAVGADPRDDRAAQQADARHDGEDGCGLRELEEDARDERAEATFAAVRSSGVCVIAGRSADCTGRVKVTLQAATAASA
jgi:hypothetical protein